MPKQDVRQRTKASRLPRSLWLCGLTSCLLACYPEEQRIDLDPSSALFFSKDTLNFDTLISGVRSPSQALRLHNPNEGSVKIKQLWLERGTSSPFIFWINGPPVRSLEDLHILGRDSVFLVIEAQIQGKGRANPVKEEDKLWVRSLAGLQHISLKVWARDAIHSQRLVIRSDTYWSERAAQHIEEELQITEGATLRIGPGMHLFFSVAAQLHVKGRLLVEGTQEAPVVFTSVRQDGNYRHTPGQWKGLIFNTHNEESVLHHARISNAEIGVRLGHPDRTEGVPIRIGYSILRHMSQGAILAYGGRTFVHNTLIYNAKNFLVAHRGGGHHRYLHCTLSNYPSSFVEVGASMQITDVLPTSPQTIRSLELYVQNTILWGALEEELRLSLRGEQLLHIEHSLFRSASGEQLDVGNNLWKNSYNYPKFVNAEEYIYSLQKDSPARNAAKIFPDTEHQQDLEGKARDMQPDIGAYEWLPSKKAHNTKRQQKAPPHHALK